MGKINQLESYFEKFASNIEPSENMRSEAITGHSTLRQRLEKDEDLQGVLVNTLLIGSYRRQTAVKPVKDVDILVVLDLDTSSDENSPSKVLNRLKRVLDKYYEAKTANQRRSIRIDLSYVTMDVVPVVAPNGTETPVLIPDRALSDWMWTNPLGHVGLTSERNETSGGRYVPLVKMLKWWRRYHAAGAERPKPKGFTLECLVGMHLDMNAPSFAEGFVSVLEGIKRSYPTLEHLEYLPDPALPGGVVPTGLSQADYDEFMKLVEESLGFAREAINADSPDTKAEHWRKVFGPEFPTPPESLSSSRVVLPPSRSGTRQGPRPLKDQPFF